MKGCELSMAIMRLSPNQQIDKLIEILQNSRDELVSLPVDERKRKAYENLHGWGIIDSDGEFREPYIILREHRYVQ